MGDVVLMESFDLYPDVTSTDVGLRSRWTYDGSTTTNRALSAGRVGGQALQQGNNTGNRCSHYLDIGQNLAGFAVGFAFKYDALAAAGLTSGASQNMIALMDAAAIHLSLHLHSNGTLQVQRGASTALGSSAAGLVVSDTWCYIEMVGTIHDTAGTIDVYHDNSLVISLTGQDTRNAANAYINRLRLCCPDGTGANGISHHDDVYVASGATRIGPRRITLMDPAADTADKDFTASAGSDNFDMLNESTVDGDATYVQSSTVGDLDLYDLSDLPVTPTSVTAVQLVAVAKKTDAGARTMNVVAKSGATQSDGPAMTLTTSYASHRRILNTDPDTSAPWTNSAIAALQAGLKVAS